jgi:hypothetical protein
MVVEATVIVDPTDRSIRPEIMTNVIPSPAMAINDIWRRMLTRLLLVSIPGANRLNRIKTPPIAPNKTNSVP